MSHFYDIDGNPAYEVVGANGKLRDTTLRDARKFNLVPSVTTIMGVLDKPALVNWIKEQIIRAVLENPFEKMGLTEDKWKTFILNESMSKGKNAADKGREIHDDLENYYKTGEIQSKYDHIVRNVVKFMNEKFPGFEFVSEVSFSHPRGFGGRVDLYGIKNRGKVNEQRMVLDFKTKDTDDEKKMKAYDEHHMQTAAYVMGIQECLIKDDFDMFKWKRYNLFISTQEFGLLKLTESKDFSREMSLFLYLTKVWQLKNNYIPDIRSES